MNLKKILKLWTKCELVGQTNQVIGSESFNFQV